MPTGYLVSPETRRRLTRLLDAGAGNALGGVIPTRTGARWVIVRCDSDEPVGTATESVLDQLYPATIIIASSEVLYPPEGEADSSVIGLPCLLTVLGYESPDSPVAVVPTVGQMYAGPLTAEVRDDPDTDPEGGIFPRQRVVSVDFYAGGGGGPVTGSGTTGMVPLWEYAGGSLNPTTVLEDSEIMKTGVGSYTVPALTASSFLNAAGVFANGLAPVFNNFANRESTWVDGVGGPTWIPPGSLSPYTFQFDGGAGNTSGMWLASEPLTAGTGARIWLIPYRGNAVGAFHHGGNLVLSNGRYCVWRSATNTVMEGKDGNLNGAIFHGGLWVSGTASGGSGTVTSVSGGSTGLTFSNPTTTPTMTGTLSPMYGGLGTSLSDPGADAVLQWNDGFGAIQYSTLDATLKFTSGVMGVDVLDFGTF